MPIGFTINRERRAISLFLGGPSRFGKTSWARSIGRHSYFCGLFNLDDYDHTGKYQIFDDFEWKFVPYRKQWFGGQLRFAVTDKYRRKTTIQNGGRPSIFLFNNDNDPRMEMTPYERIYYEKNSIFIDLEREMF